jgi:PAS domain S-box-containing protein
MPDPAVITITSSGRVVDISESAQRVLGLGDNATGKRVADLLAQVMLEASERPDLGAALSQDPSCLLGRELAVTALGADGHPFAASLSVARGSLDSRHFCVRIYDVSTRGAAGAGSRDRRATRERASEAPGIGSWDWDLRTGALRWSDNLFRMFGLQPGALLPTLEYLIEHTHPEDRDLVRHRLVVDSAAADLGMVEYRIVREDGSVRNVQRIAASIEEDDGVPRRLVGTVQDVTERRQTAGEVAAHIAIEEVLAAWTSFDEGAQRLLAGLGEALDFAIGVLWVRQDDSLHARSLWSSRSSRACQSDIEISKQPLASAPVQSLPVRTWLSRQPSVVMSLADAPAFPGRDAAVGAGLRGAVALPAVSGDRALAVLEFYSREMVQPTGTWLRSLTGMGYELGHFFARRSCDLRPHELTPREREVLQLAAHGMSGKQIAQHLSLSPATVKTHFEHIYSKWAVSDRAGAVAKAMREGLIE